MASQHIQLVVIIMDHMKQAESQNWNCTYNGGENSSKSINPTALTSTQRLPKKVSQSLANGSKEKNRANSKCIGGIEVPLKA